MLGKVLESLPSGVFRVQLDTGEIVRAHVAGRDRAGIVRILPGDRVQVEQSPYDASRARIVQRLDKREHE